MHILPGLNMACFVKNVLWETKLGICNQGDLTKSKSYERPINKILQLIDITRTPTHLITYHFSANSLVGNRAC